MKDDKCFSIVVVFLMLHHVPAAARFVADLGAVQGRFLFSFAHYYDPANVALGPLRVLNDYRLAPRSSQPLHPHSEIEIVTIVLAGALTYADAAGNLRDLRAGQVLRLTAGAAFQHAESNRGATAAHALELWFAPGQPNLQPSQEQKAIDFPARANEWTPLVSGRGDGGAAAVFLNGDATVWWANLTPGATLAYAADESRQHLVYAVDGSAALNGERLEAGDHVRLSGETHLTVASPAGARVLLVDVPR